MSNIINRQITLASRPVGEPKDENFKLVESPVGKPADGEVLLHTLYLSLDPYMRGRMSDAKSYAQPVPIGGVMEGGTVSEVIISRHPDFMPGDFVAGYSGWQSYAIVKGSTLTKIDSASAPISTALGVLGMPGMTAYTGLLNIGQPKSGETVVVAAASGAVGGIVGQIAKIKGCRVIGIAGGKHKCDYVVKELGFDACLDHKDKNLAEQLKSACPKGIDVYFENVGGAVFEAVFPLLNDFARIPVCGLISNYNDTALPDGPNMVPLLMRAILTKRLLFQGFIVSDFASQRMDFIKDVSQWIREGKVKYREDIVDGLENAPKAFQGLLRGENFGKLLVRVGSK
ncbi:MAG: NADP-dependent oxidoreductase [Candidatus Obscuribacterales bacterium]|nr:NADP-dependent oxidoreductase [Candidatus Obscuribacterales bacterium]